MPSAHCLNTHTRIAEYIATSLGSYLTSQSGVTIVFESAIVPRFAWRESKLTFKNVYVSRGMGSTIDTLPAQEDDDVGPPQKANNVRRATGQDLAGLKERNNQRTSETIKPTQPEGEAALVIADTADPAVQYTNFHVSIDSIDITLSLPRWLDGKGLVREAAVKGVRGVIGETAVDI